MQVRVLTTCQEQMGSVLGESNLCRIAVESVLWPYQLSDSVSCLVLPFRRQGLIDKTHGTIGTVDRDGMSFLTFPSPSPDPEDKKEISKVVKRTDCTPDAISSGVVFSVDGKMKGKFA